MFSRHLAILFFICMGFAPVYAQPVSVVKDTTNSVVLSGLKYYIYSIKPGQTLYSISKAYGVTTDDILNANDDVKEIGLKSGKTIKIPAKKGKVQTAAVSPSNPVNSLTPAPIASVKIENPPTLVISDSLTKMLAKQCAKKSIKKPVYDVGLFLPLHGDTGKYNIKSSVALEFYEGALMAAEDFNDAETTLRIHIYDTQNDSTNVKEVLKKDEIKTLDLIIGPLFASGFERVSNYLLTDSIVCVSPFSQTYKVIEDNPNTHKITPSAVTIVDQCVKFIASEFGNQNVVFISNTITKDNGNMVLYRDRLKSTVPFKEHTYSATGALHENFLVAGKKNLVIFPSGDQTAVSLLITRLTELSGKYDITLWGLNQWQNFDDLDIQKLSKLNMHFARTSFADKNTSKVTKLNERYKDQYKANASEYFYHGYDVMYYYGQMLKKYGRNLTPCLLCEGEQKGIQTNIRFGLNSTKPGIENTSIIIMEYKNNRIARVTKP